MTALQEGGFRDRAGIVGMEVLGLAPLLSLNYHCLQQLGPKYSGRHSGILSAGLVSLLNNLSSACSLALPVSGLEYCLCRKPHRSSGRFQCVQAPIVPCIVCGSTSSMLRPEHTWSSFGGLCGHSLAHIGRGQDALPN